MCKLSAFGYYKCTLKERGGIAEPINSMSCVQYIHAYYIYIYIFIQAKNLHSLWWLSRITYAFENVFIHLNCLASGAKKKKKIAIYQNAWWLRGMWPGRCNEAIIAHVFLYIYIALKNMYERICREKQISSVWKHV